MTQQPKFSTQTLLVQISLFAAIVVADSYGLVPITQTLFLLPLIWLFFRLKNEPWSSIGLALPTHFWRAIGLGVLAGVLMELFAVYVTTPYISAYFGVEPDYSNFKKIYGNLTVLFVFIGLSWTLAAFGEEICFRGFLMKRLAQLFGTGKAAWIISLVLSSIFFGWGHTEQGVAGWIQEALSGFLLGSLFLLSNRNLSVPIIAHGVSNTLAFVLMYFGQYPGQGLH